MSVTRSSDNLLVFAKAPAFCPKHFRQSVDGSVPRRFVCWLSVNHEGECDSPLAEEARRGELQASPDATGEP